MQTGRLGLFFGLVLPLMNGFGQEVRFKGNAPFFSGKTIQIKAYGDLLIQSEFTLDETTIDADGNFELRLSELSDSLVNYHLLLERERTALHPEAGKTYELIIPGSDPGQIGLTDNNDTSGYWFEVSSFNRWYNDFIADNYEAFTKGDYRSMTLRFAKESKERYGNHPLPYVRQMAAYRIADLLMVTRLIGEQKAAESYLFNQEVLYDHPDYLAFFKDVYKGKLLEWASQSSGGKLYDAIMTKPNYDSLFHYVMQQELITGREVGELFVVYGLFDWHYEKGIPKAKLLHLLRRAQEKQVHPRLKQITRHFIQDLDKLSPGKPAPALEALDPMGKSFSLNDFKDKWAVYLVFFSAQNPGTLSELLGTRAFFGPFEKELKVVGICLDCNFTSLHQLVKKHDLKGSFGLINPEITRAYDLQGSSAYYLIDKQGNLVHAPAAPPSLGGFDQIYKLVK